MKTTVLNGKTHLIIRRDVCGVEVVDPETCETRWIPDLSFEFITSHEPSMVPDVVPLGERPDSWWDEVRRKRAEYRKPSRRTKGQSKGVGEKEKKKVTRKKVMGLDVSAQAKINSLSPEMQRMMQNVLKRI